MTRPARAWRACVALALTLALVDCKREPRAAASTPAAASPDAPHDRIVARAAPGVPADSFPAPARAVASIVASRWTDEDDRDRVGEAERVMALLGVRAGMRVADVGAGDGYYTTRLADRVGPSGRVYGQDIMPDYLEALQRRVRGGQRPNVTLVLGDAHDPRLPADAVDLVLMVHMYHEIEQPFGLLYNLYPSLRPGARVAVLDLDRETDRHGTPPALLRCEFESMGYRREQVHALAPGEYLAVFAAPPSASALTAPGSVRARLRACGSGA